MSDDLAALEGWTEPPSHPDAYAFGADRWPGLGKLVEEAGGFQRVLESGHLDVFLGTNFGGGRRG